MIMLPCPDTCSLLCLSELAVYFFCIDQRYIAFIRFRLLINHLEDTFCTCQRHNNTVELLTDLVNRHIEALVKGQEACQPTQSQTGNMVQSKNTSNDGTYYITEITKLRIDRSKEVGIFIRIICTIKQFIIDLIELLNILIFMAEYLNNLLAFHHFFNVAIDSPQCPLLFDEVFTGCSGCHLCYI